MVASLIMKLFGSLNIDTHRSYQYTYSPRLPSYYYLVYLLHVDIGYLPTYFLKLPTHLSWLPTYLEYLCI
jgi:hypothetical protein